MTLPATLGEHEAAHHDDLVGRLAAIEQHLARIAADADAARSGIDWLVQTARQGLALAATVRDNAPGRAGRILRDLLP